jgi:hypothetical protein
VKTKVFFLSVIVILGAITTKADPLFIRNATALQNNGATTVDLFSNPGTTLFGPQMIFQIDITGTLPLLGTDTLLVTYVESGQTPITQSFQIPLFGTVAPPFTLQLEITSLCATSEGISATLTFDLLNSSPDFEIPSGPNAGERVNSITYAFNVAEPIPEPATLALLGSGFGGLLLRRRRRP